MRVAVDELVPVREPQMRVQHEQILSMFLRPGSIELARLATLRDGQVEI